MTRDANRTDRRRHRPRMEGLEDRKLLYATLGANWNYGSRITYSFAPDGTNIGGNSSVLYQAMQNRGITQAQWQAAFAKAAAVWQVVTNVNLAQVSDDGTAFGGDGNQQGDPDFGDIRIGGTALNSGTLASCFLPPPINGGSLAGDIVVNTNQPWQVGSDYDLQTVAIHEFGHALGMDHSAISSADMYAYYTGMKQALTSDDTAGLQSVYGARANDAFDAAAANNAITAATNITGYLNGLAQETLTGLDIKTSADLDWYTVAAPSGTTGTMTVRMQSSNLSSLNPSLSVYNAAKQLVGSASAAGFGSTITVSLGGVQAGQVYYVKCGASTSGAGSNGAYALLVNFGSSPLNPAPPPNTVVPAQPNQGGGSGNEILGDPTSAVVGKKGKDKGDKHQVQIGSLSGAGDDLRVAPRFRHRGRHHPRLAARDSAIAAWHRHA